MISLKLHSSKGNAKHSYRISGLPLLCSFCSWNASCIFLENVLLQNLQEYLCIPRCKFSWAFKVHFCVKDLPHDLHEKGRTPEWINSCLLSLFIEGKDLWQILHFFSLTECVIECHSSLCLWENGFWHILHEYLKCSGFCLCFFFHNCDE